MTHRPAIGTSSRQRGFTLIELMIVVVVIGTLAMLALPTYRDSVRKSRRADAITEITRIQQAQERWRGNNATFNGTLVGAAATTLGFATNLTPGGYYALSIATPATSATGGAIAGATNATSYSSLATAQGDQTADTNCRVLKANLVGGDISYLAGATATTLADVTTSPTARRCWNR